MPHAGYSWLTLPGTVGRTGQHRPRHAPMPQLSTTGCGETCATAHRRPGRAALARYGLPRAGLPHTTRDRLPGPRRMLPGTRGRCGGPSRHVREGETWRAPVWWVGWRLTYCAGPVRDRPDTEGQT